MGELAVPTGQPRIIVVGLGPGDPSLLTVATVEAIARVRCRILRTTVHPSAAVVPDGESFDHLYDSLGSFADVYTTVVSSLLSRVHEVGELLYAVPGSPAVAEHTVELLLQRAPGAGVVVEVLPALSFADLAWVRLGVDPLANPVTLIDAHRFVDDVAGRRGPFLVAQCHSNVVMGDIKLALTDGVIDPAALPPITILHHLGLADERIVEVHWSKLDQTVIADHLTSVYIPELPGQVGVATDRVWSLMQRLRRECPWNEEQTPQTLAPYAVEEAHELAEAVAALVIAAPEGHEVPAGVSAKVSAKVSAEAVAHYAQELGDVLYQVLFHSAVAADEGWFSLDDVITRLHHKLEYRHPHLFPRPDFDPGEISTSDDVVRNWELIKAAERASRVAAGSLPGPGTGLSSGL